MCYAVRGLSCVSLAHVIGALDTDTVAAANIRLAAAMCPNKAAAVQAALGSKAPLFPIIPVVAAFRQAIQRHTAEAEILAAVPAAQLASADFALMVRELID